MQYYYNFIGDQYEKKLKKSIMRLFDLRHLLLDHLICFLQELNLYIQMYWKFDFFCPPTNKARQITHKADAGNNHRTN